MRTLSPLPWLCTVATTLPPFRNGEPILTLSPCPTSSTLSNSTLAPASAVSFSTRKTEPSLTRYCLPPVEITAYMSTQAPEWPGTRRKRACSVRRAAVSGKFQRIQCFQRLHWRRKEVAGQRGASFGYHFQSPG